MIINWYQITSEEAIRDCYTEFCLFRQEKEKDPVLLFVERVIDALLDPSDLKHFKNDSRSVKSTLEDMAAERARVGQVTKLDFTDTFVNYYLRQIFGEFCYFQPENVQRADKTLRFLQWIMLNYSVSYK